MITISGKQNDNEVETSTVHLMQMYMFHIEVLQKSKYFYPAGQPSLTHPFCNVTVLIGREVNIDIFMFCMTNFIWNQP